MGRAQVRGRRKRRPDTVPEVFNIESLDLGDERKARREGAVLASVLRMCGKKGVISVAAPAKDIQFDHAVAHELGSDRGCVASAGELRMGRRYRAEGLLQG